MKIELWGTYPPPIGGVTIHICRLIYHLSKLDKSIILKNFGKRNNNQVSNVENVRYTWLEFLKLPFSSKKLIHLHSNNWISFLLILLLGSKHRIDLTIHNKRFINETSFLKCKIIKMFLDKASFIIMNDEGYKNELISKFDCQPDIIHILPAFLPPVPFEYKGLDSDFMKFRKQHKFLMSANAFQLKLENGIDVYGADLMIELVLRLKKKNIDVGLVFCLPNIGDKEYYNQLLNKIKALDLDNNIMIAQKEITNGFEIWEMSDLFLRPTSTDMEGISVKEALYCGTPAVVSNVCKRPKEAILFESRNIEDFVSKVLIAYDVKKTNKDIDFTFNEDTIPQIYEIYKSSLK